MRAYHYLNASRGGVMDRAVNRLYFSHTCGHPECMALDAVPDLVLAWQDLYNNTEKLYADVTAGRIPPEELEPGLVKSYTGTLSKPFKEGLKSNFDAPSFNEPNYNFIRAAHSNLYQFAGAKTYQELKELNAMFMRDGKVVPFNEFKRNVAAYRKDVQNIKEKYHKNWLEAEYTHARRTSRSVERWQRFQEDRDLYENLIYLTSQDNRVREAHQKLHGTILPIDHEFWDTYYVPNGWRCRCRVEQTNRKATENVPSIDLKPEFSNNPAKTGNIYPEKHPYFQGYEDLKEKVKEKAGGMARQVYVEAQEKTFQAYRGREDFQVSKFDRESGGYLVKHRSHQTPTQAEQVIIEQLVQAGEAVVIPEHTNAPFTKNPDLIVNGARMEIKGASGSRTSVRDRILEGSGQARFVLVNLEDVKTSNVAQGIAEAKRKLKADQLNGVLLVHQGRRVFVDRAALNSPEALKKLVKELK